MTVSIDDSVAWCRRLSRRTAGNFYFSFLTLPRECFQDMCVLYAFMRLSDDLGDDASLPVEERARRLEQWRIDLRRALAGEPTDHPVFPALVQMIQRHRIPPQYLFDVIAGVERDLQPVGFETFDELMDYCYHVAGAVGLCCVHVWGYRDERALDLAVDCGRAFQLTNILRDLGEDAAHGRVYLPREDLRRFDYSEEDLAAQRRDDRFVRLMQFQTQRARGFYRRAEQLLDLLDPAGRAVYGAMLRIYGGLLREIERNGYDVFTRPIRLSKARKLAIMLGATIRHRLLGRLRKA